MPDSNLTISIADLSNSERNAYKDGILWQRASMKDPGRCRRLAKINLGRSEWTEDCPEAIMFRMGWKDSAEGNLKIGEDELKRPF